MENIELKSGNIVERISDKQKMIVFKNENGEIWCDYFDKQFELHRNPYARNELTFVERPKFRCGDVVRTSENFKGEIVEPHTKGLMVVVSVTENKPTCTYHSKTGSPHDVEFEENDLEMVKPYSKIS
ncbi:MAG TPA: hypothetical protein PLL99_01585 [Chitinophagales bacterium]|jgi:hypothetical protein|nr:hypothetical protein [Chitinophagales bacterium]